VKNKLLIILSLCLNFVLANTCVAANADRQTVSVLPVNASEIDSIAVEPQQNKVVSTYALKIFLSKNNSGKVISVIRPLDGDLVDLKLHDIDDDGVDEVIVIMADHNTTAVHIHFDIFEFDGKKISLVKNFTQLAKLYELFSTTLQGNLN